MNDSVNVFHRRAIRVNQVGYLPDDTKKFAWVATSSGGLFHLIDSQGQSVFEGTLTKVGDYAVPKSTAKGYASQITLEYSFEITSSTSETLYLADFGELKTTGQYRMVYGTDTSATFSIQAGIYAQVLEKVLFFFGANRCGNTHSWIHAACHLKDGSALGSSFEGRLAGGWHDCGDHLKTSPGIAFTALVLSMAANIWPDRTVDLYGASYSEKKPDGIPDVLGEAKIGVDYVYNLYLASKEIGLLDSSDLYHSIGYMGSDHGSWDLPEKQDAAPLNMGGPDRPIKKMTGSDIAGSYSAALAFYSHAWRDRDPASALKMEMAAIEIYDNVVMKKVGTHTSTEPYGMSPYSEDDEAMAALALWYSTGESRFGFDLLRNQSIHSNPRGDEPGQFSAGHLGAFFYGNGSAITNYSSIHTFVLYALAKLILPTAEVASKYGVSVATRDSLLSDIHVWLAKHIAMGPSKSDSVSFAGMRVEQPYHGVYSGSTWGFNAYNLGKVNEILMYHDLTQAEPYRRIAIDNLNYLLGGNPYDVSFINGCGDRNLQHPHHRASNPEGYYPLGASYAYQPLVGAVMGGAIPGSSLTDEWQQYIQSESCIDYASEAVISLLLLSPKADEAATILRANRNSPRTAPVGKSHRLSKKHGDIRGRKSNSGIHPFFAFPPDLLNFME